MVDRALPLDGPVGDPLGEPPVAGVEPAGRRVSGPVGVGPVLEDAPHDLERGAAGRGDHARMPRANSS